MPPNGGPPATIRRAALRVYSRARVLIKSSCGNLIAALCWLLRVLGATPGSGLPRTIHRNSPRRLDRRGFCVLPIPPAKALRSKRSLLHGIESAHAWVQGTGPTLAGAYAEAAAPSGLV